MPAHPWCVALLIACKAPAQSDGGDPPADAGTAVAADAAEPLADATAAEAIAADAAATAETAAAETILAAAPDGVDSAAAAADGDGDGLGPADAPAPADAGAELTSPLCRKAVTAPAWYHGAVGYEIFVRSFQDSDGDGVGDWAGLTSRLDYLNDGKPGGADLGIDLIWLMPVLDSPSYHGYDVRDYRKLNAVYGSEADFDAFLTAAHARGIRVILDLVLNHSSQKHPWFVASAAETDKLDWYLWAKSNPGWKQPFGSKDTWHPAGKRWYYGIFSTVMPDLNYANPAVTAEMTATGAFWLDRGVDGFRLDAVRYLLEAGPGGAQQDTQATVDWWQAWATQLRQHQSAAGMDEPLLVGEAWTANKTAAKYHAGGKALNMTFDFDLSAALLAGLNAGSLADVEAVVCGEDALFPPQFSRGSFLANHDMVRLASQVPTEALRRLAAVLLLTLPGTPWLYYGEEIGMKNGPGSDDRDKRTPMQWQPGASAGFSSGQPWQPVNSDAATVSVQAEQGKMDSLLTLYQKLIAARRSLAALQVGEARLLGKGPLRGLLRVQGAERVLLALNFGETAATPQWQSADVGPFTAAKDLLSGQQVALAAGWPVVPALGFWLLQLE